MKRLYQNVSSHIFAFVLGGVSAAILMALFTMLQPVCLDNGRWGGWGGGSDTGCSDNNGWSFFSRYFLMNCPTNCVHLNPLQSGFCHR